MLIYHKGHTETIQVYSVTVMTNVKALQAGHSSQGTSEPITPACRGTPETPADNTGCSLRARTEVVILYTDMGVRFEREPK